MNKNSISKKLLTRVLSLYFVLTFLVTGLQILAEYYNTKSHINSELLTLEKTFSSSLTRAVWELNTQQAKDIAEGLVAIPMIKGITVRDENQQIIAQLGQQLDGTNGTAAPAQLSSLPAFSESYFGHTFPLIFEFSGRTTEVGSVTLLSSNQVVFNRIEVGIYFLIGNAMIKTAALILLFSLAFSKLLSRPLFSLTEQIKQFDVEDPEAYKLHHISYEHNELTILETAYNNLIDELVIHKEKFAQVQGDLVRANLKLDEQNLLLEQEVARKTSSLSTTMLEMEQQQRELLSQKEQLQTENNRRKQTETRLIATNQELTSLINELHQAQECLLDAEKMANLGNLSAEISHEINTPIGIGITSSSYLEELLKKLELSVTEQSLSKRELGEYIDNSKQSIALLLNNLQRALELISSFKQIAVDQTSNKIRQVNVAKYLDEIIQSLHPKLKKTSHRISIDCPSDLTIHVHAGAIAQIFSNLIINSIIHGFEQVNRGEINISISRYQQKIVIDYSDNGCGVTPEQLDKLFDPFYTTKEALGGSGLGTHIVHNLVHDVLNGTVEATSEPNQGLHYHIEFEDMS